MFVGVCRRAVLHHIFIIIIYIWGGCYFAPVVEMINLVRDHVGVINLRPWVKNAGLYKIVEFVQAISHNTNLIVGLDLFFLGCICLSLCQCGNVVGPPPNINKAIKRIYNPAPWLPVFSMPWKVLGDAPLPF